MTPHDRLRGLASFLPAFESAAFEFGKWSDAESIERGVSTQLRFELSETAAAFVKAAYDLGWVAPHFDWVTWEGHSRGEEPPRRPSVPGQS
jgi:hypothetical protein